ncbi:NAD(P)-binding domain containing protein [Parasponia andersonii]|uniref:NAD(P)-binding domain containing protein n=1 Tax=Parasponia andersonii TaxID=3476 RepID=A0A2P5CSG9_PARAD|nr:NAD(P)-binding domain containing protein [Parasponia andersonii]
MYEVNIKNDANVCKCKNRTSVMHKKRRQAVFGQWPAKRPRAAGPLSRPSATCLPASGTGAAAQLVEQFAKLLGCYVVVCA